MQNNDRSRITHVLGAMCDAVERNQVYLGELDAALGDGDHGVSMAKSFRAIRATLPGMQEQSVAEILRSVGMTLISEVGGAMGPLFGTAFLYAGKTATGKESLTGVDVADMLAAAEAGIVHRGKAQQGDKTMLDALHPAVDSARSVAASGAGVAAVVAAAAKAAHEGALATTTMVARVGRASRLGERTLGHQDAGATSVAILLDAAASAAGRFGLESESGSDVTP